MSNVRWTFEAMVLASHDRFNNTTTNFDNTAIESRRLVPIKVSSMQRYFFPG